MICLIFQSFKVRNKKFVLLILEFTIGFTALIYGLCNIESLFRYRNAIKNVVPLNVVHINIFKNEIHEITQNEINNYQFIISKIKECQDIKQFGIFQKMYLYQSESKCDEDNESVYMLNNDMLHLVHIRLKEGKIDELNNYERDDDLIPVLVSDKLSDKFPMNHIIERFQPMGEKITKRKFKVVGVLADDMCFFYGGQSTSSESMNTNQEFVIAPCYMDFNSQIPFCYNMFVSTTNDNGYVLDEINKVFIENGITSQLSTIREEIYSYYQRQKPIIIYTILFSIILLLLSIIGCIGTILSSIACRKREYGIYFSLGFTKNNLYQFVCGEIGLLLFTSLIIAIVISLILFNVLLKNIGIIVNLRIIFYSVILMVLCTFLCIVIPLRKISKFTPIDLLNERNS